MKFMLEPSEFGGETQSENDSQTIQFFLSGVCTLAFHRKK